MNSPEEKEKIWEDREDRLGPLSARTRWNAETWSLWNEHVKWLQNRDYYTCIIAFDNQSAALIGEVELIQNGYVVYEEPKELGSIWASHLYIRYRVRWAIPKN